MTERKVPPRLDQRRSSAPMTSRSPAEQPRHSSFCHQPHRLSIAERFMSSSLSHPDTKNINFDPTYHPSTYRASNDSPQLHPHSLSLDHATYDQDQPLDQHLCTTDTITTHSRTSLNPPPLEKRQHFSKKSTKRLYSEHHRPQNKIDTALPPPKSSVPPSYTPHAKTIEKPVWPGKKVPSKEHYRSTRGCLLLCFFFFILFGGFFLFLIWPRVPLLRIEGASVISPVEIVQNQQGWMENVMFTTSWLVNVTVDNRQNYLPTRLNKVQVIVKDAATNALVGKGAHNDDPMDVVLMDGISTVSLLVTVNYQARDMSDPTLADLVHACHRPTASSLPLHFWITLYIFGFDWLGFTPTVIATPASSGFSCPV
ncbi:hypothetical protein [Absidia glauca]|uniref:Uncharacterized protein n=1 Tax=Absidia glauca TaxID=4829 RepID=A0A163J295_ABSGL|nr:hypothetical protein [Absidia glauca]